jgi:tRNA A37 threonylcarbamoyladenosine dehydratase
VCVSDDVWADVVVDCIDNVDTKADLVHYCAQKRVGVVVCTGSGA